MSSLRARLFVGLSVLIVATNVVFGALSLRRAIEEASEFQDAVLTQVGHFAVSNRLTTETLAHYEADARVVIEEADAAPEPGGLLATAPNAADGLSTILRNGQAWRLLMRTRTNGDRVAIGQSMSSRDDVVRDAVFGTTLFVLMVIPCLLVLVGLIIHLSVRPITQLAARLDARSADDLRALPTVGIPNELRPFIASINRLFERVEQLFEQRRRFVADSAHELRTPLTALTVQVDNLSHLDLPAEGRQRLAALQAGIRRTAHLVEQLLSLARYEAATATPKQVVALDVLARSVVADLLPDATDAGLDLGFLRQEPVWVRCDPIALGAMVRNLIDNAVKHASDGRRIDVEVFRNEDRAIVRIEDFGPGLPTAELARVLDHFVRGSRASGVGTGLGLSIVKSVAEMCDGSVTLANRGGDEGGGLIATVDLPAIDPPIG